MSFCSECGFDIGGAVNFCARCGTNIQPTNQGLADNVDQMANNTSSMISSQLVGNVVKDTVSVAKSTVKAKIYAITLIAALVTAGTILFNMYFITKPIDVVNKLFNAINEKDLNTAMQCLDPSQEKLYNATSAIVNKFIGVSLKDMADLFPALLPMMGQSANADMSQIVDWNISTKKVISEQKSDSEATLKLMVRVELTERNGKKNIEEGEGMVRLKKFNVGWRIVELD